MLTSHRPSALPPSPGSGSKPVQLDLRFLPNAELVSVVRKFVANFYSHVLGDSDAVSRVALASHELLENAAKYSADGATALTVVVTHRATESGVEIRISNRAEPAHLLAVSEAFAEMSQAPDAFAHYQSCMIRSAKRTDGSGLGLVRIRAEGEMTLRHSIDGDRLIICAETTVSRSST